MGRRGPQPAAKPLKLLRDGRPDRLPKGRAPAVAGLPAPPDFLNDVAREEWDRILPQLAEAGVLGRVDGAALALYCVAFARWRTALDDVETNGLLTACEYGFKANPAVSIAAQAENQMAKLLAEFGATPASRGRVRVDDKPPADKLGEFLGKRKA